MGRVRDLAHDVPTELLAGMLNTLPVELSLVDADDTVRYFNHENEKKIFVNVPGIDALTLFVVSVSVTLLAVSGPLFVTVIV